MSGPTPGDGAKSRGARPAREAAGWEDERLVQQVVERRSCGHFELLMSRYQHKVLQLAAGVLGYEFHDQLEDAAQAVFVRAFNRLHTFRGESRFSTWLYRLAYNVAVDERRKLKRLRAHHAEAAGERPSNRPGPQAEQIRLEREQAVRAAVLRLPESYRIIVRLYYWQELSVSEIAELLAANPGTVKSYLFRARQRVAQLLGDDP